MSAVMQYDSQTHRLRKLLPMLLALAALVASGADLRPCWRNLTPDARAKLAEYAKQAEGWKAHTERPQMLVRGQFFYGLERGDYIHYWYERPLMQDSSFQPFGDRGHMLNERSWRRTVDTARAMHLDAFAFFPSNPRCWDLLPRSALPGAGIPLLPELHNGDRGRGVEHCLGVLERISVMPNAFRINGRIVITCYPVADPTDEATLGFWPKLKAAADARFGKGTFAFMPYMRVFNPRDLDRRETTGETLERTRELLRNTLRKTDGLFYWMRESGWAPPDRLREPHDTIVSSLVRSVLAEPEFKDKFLGVGHWQAHENNYRRFADVSSMGMLRLKTALETIDRLRPDFAIGFEWDEENENTHFRPTVSNGQTTQRIMRHFTDKMAGIRQTPYPGDTDLSIPNLVLAYRKTLECGESATAQVIGIPDGTATDAVWQVSFRWRTPDGRTIKTFPPQKLDTAVCSLVSFTCPAAELSEDRLVLPELTVSGQALGTRIFSDGFWPMNVEANRNLDSKWVRHALREMPQGIAGRIEAAAPAADGTVTVTGRIQGPKRFRSIEVLENSDTIYMHSAAAPSGRDPDTVSLSISFLALEAFWREHGATGTIRVVGAPHAILSEDHSPYTRRKGMKWTLAHKPSRFNFLNTHYIDMPRAEAAQAEIVIDLPSEMPNRHIKVSDVMRDDAYSFGINGGGQAVVRHLLTQRSIPPPPNVSEASFSFTMKPQNPLSVLRLQAIDEDFRVWRGNALTFFRPAGKKTTFHVYDVAAESAREVSLDANRLVSLTYDFSVARGDIWFSGPWRDLPCVGGGGVGLFTGFGCGASKGYSHALGPVRPKLWEREGCGITVPRRTELAEGGYALDFKGCAFASLPLNFNPRYAGYAVELRLFPDDLKGRQGLLDSGAQGMQLWLEDDAPCAFICFGNWIAARGVNEVAGARVKGPPLAAGRWNTIRLVFDQKTARIETNGVSGEPVEACGMASNSDCMALGMVIRTLDFFHGRISSLSIEPR